MYSGGKIKDGDILYLGNAFYSSPAFDAFTKYVNAAIYQAEKFINRRGGLQIYFGINSRQDSEYLYIKKSDLLGLTAAINNTAESLLVALIINSMSKTNELDDKLTFQVFDQYINANKITTTLLIYLFYQPSIESIELETDYPIKPDNYGV